MTFVDLLDRIYANTLELCSKETTTTTSYATLVNIASLEGLLTVLKEKLGIVEESLEGEETNGDIFTVDCRDPLYSYAYTDMPNGNEKWFKGRRYNRLNQAANWIALKEDPTLDRRFAKRD